MISMPTSLGICVTIVTYYNKWPQIPHKMICQEYSFGFTISNYSHHVTYNFAKKIANDFYASCIISFARTCDHYNDFSEKHIQSHMWVSIIAECWMMITLTFFLSWESWSWHHDPIFSIMKLLGVETTNFYDYSWSYLKMTHHG